MTRIAVLTATALAAALFVASVPPAAPATAKASKASTLALTMSVVDISPWTPIPTKTEQPLSVTVELSNTTDSDIDHVVLGGGRGTPVNGDRSDPLSIQSKLDSSLSDHKLPSGLFPVPARPAARAGLDVPANSVRFATFTTTTTTSTPSLGLCLCANAVYPIYISAYDSQTSELEGFTRTYLASVDGAHDTTHHPLQRVGVSWVWPLIDRPHRLAAGRVFTDRGLLAEISPAGRLSRALQVAQDIGSDAGIPMTLVLDPELVDELAILSQGSFSYSSGAGRTVAGTASVAARSWLSRLRAVLSDGDIDVQFTPYADPDIQSLTAGGLRWRTDLPPTMLARVRHALGMSTLHSTLSWPPTGAVSKGTLSRVAAAGATSVLLDDSSVRPTNLNGVPTATATLHTPQGSLAAALTSPAMQADVAAATGRSPDLSKLPPLLAELAVRADETPYVQRVAFLSPPRYVDPDVVAAENVIRETTSSAISQPMSVGTALAEGASSGSEHAHTRHLSATTPGLSPAILGAAEQVSRSLPALHSMLTGTGQSPAALPLLTDLGRGLQRVESAAYLSSSPLSGPAVGAKLADQLRRQVSGLLAGVHIVRPDSGKHGYAYTLASTNSPLPITIENSLPYRVFIHITVATVGGLPGLTTKDLGDQYIAPDSKQTFRVPAHVQRSGRYALTATLTTAGHDFVLGPRVRLSVHSTVFGTVGVVITVVAALVLLLALLLRYVRRIQRLRRKRRASPDERAVPAKV